MHIANYLLYYILLLATSGANSVSRGHGRDTALSITMPVVSVLAVIIILVILALCIVRNIKRNKTKK